MDFGEHVYPALMPAALVRGVDPRVNDELGHLVAHDAGAKGGCIDAVLEGGGKAYGLDADIKAMVVAGDGGDLLLVRRLLCL